MTAVLVLLDNILLSYGILYCSLDLFSTYFSYQNLIWKICWVRLEGIQDKGKKKFYYMNGFLVMECWLLPIYLSSVNFWQKKKKEKGNQNCYILCSLPVVGKIILWARRYYEMIFWRR